MRRERPAPTKTIWQCRVSGSRGGKVAAFGRDKARRKGVPVTLPAVGKSAHVDARGG
jgi:hypothetical protein